VELSQMREAYLPPYFGGKGLGNDHKGIWEGRMRRLRQILMTKW